MDLLFRGKKEKIWDKVFLPPLERDQWVIFRPRLDDHRKHREEYHHKELIGKVDKEIDPLYWWGEDYRGGRTYFIVVEIFNFSYHRPLKAYRSELTPISKPSRLRLFLRALRRSLNESE